MADDAAEYQCDWCGNYYELSEHADDADTELAASYCSECIKEDC